MKPDKKYMSESSYAPGEIHFTPPSFSSTIRQSNISGEQNSEDNSYLNLYPSETEEEFLYCYYSSFGDCEFNNITNSKFPSYNNPTPSSSAVLRNMDLDMDDLYDPDRKKDNTDVERIYSMIEKNHRTLFNTFSSYRIPYPVAKIMIKRIIKLTLSYCKKEGDY